MCVCRKGVIDSDLDITADSEGDNAKEEVNPPQLERAETTHMATMEIRDNQSRIDRNVSFNLSSRGIQSQRCADIGNRMQGNFLRFYRRLFENLIIHFPSDRSTYDAIGRTDEREERCNYDNT